MKMWSGRFTEENAKEVDDFNNSLKFDKILYKYDILGSAAHVKMLGKQRIIENEDADEILDSLTELLGELKTNANNILNAGKYEDIHMAIESILTEKIGDSAKRMHTARSRNDQVALDTKMYVKKQIGFISSRLKTLIEVLLNIAQENLDTIMPGYTHLQRAQTVTLAHHLTAYTEMFLRDISRLEDSYKRADAMPLGAGALAGSTFEIDREYVRDELEFEDISLNSLDSVSDRDYVIELLSNISLIMMHLSRFSEELIIWATDEFKFVTMSDKYSTGSSMMPQKKNPDVAELIRGKTGRAYGNLITMLTVMKGLPLAYNKDMQEDKEALIDSITTVKTCISIFTGMIDTTTFNKDNMAAACEDSFVNATDVSEYLVKKGCPFRDAHFIVGKLVGRCERENKYLADLTLDQFKQESDLFEDDIYDILNVKTGLEKKNMPGSPKREVVEDYICKVREELE